MYDIFTASGSDASKMVTRSFQRKRLETMHEELRALDNNNTRSLVLRTPCMNIEGSKWVYKTKLTSYLSFECLKARLVA